MPYEQIVVIEDQQAMVELLRIELESAGYQVLSVPDGKAGLELIERKHPQLVILDVLLPEMDGYEILKILKANPSTQAIPVVLLTARSLDADIEKGLELDADDYICKPFHPDLLIKRIKTLLGHHGEHRSKVSQDETVKKILIVEDEQEMRKMLAIELESQGYWVFEADNGDMGFTLARTVKPDLIISDILMSPTNGNQLLKMLRESDFGCHIPFVVLTARGKMRDYFETMDVDGFIEKPFDAHVLLAKIEGILDRIPPNASKEDNVEKLGKPLPQKRKILILEDEEKLSEVFQNIFRDYGYEVKIIHSVPECLQEAILFNPDLIISKYLVEGMTADKIIGLLRCMPKLKDTPIVVYAKSFLERHARKSVLQAGAADFLMDGAGTKLLKKANDLFRRK